jgi:hypothetical protein
VPADVIAYDDALATTTPVVASADALTPGFVAGFAATISAPVFLCFASIDLTTEPLREVGLYRDSRDITLFRLDGSAHCHNFATSRHALWERLPRWAASL